MLEHEADLKPNAWLSHPKILKSFIPTGNVPVDDLERSARRTMVLYNKCQSALNFDPWSARNSDPCVRRDLAE